ncbi:hypothetical protein F1880_004787 [Penicillium rolfsii]|nr:hypothetical protein F1880_004787 [Penicillium rolfsii]
MPRIDYDHYELWLAQCKVNSPTEPCHWILLMVHPNDSHCIWYHSVNETGEAEDFEMLIEPNKRFNSWSFDEKFYLGMFPTEYGVTHNRASHDARPCATEMGVTAYYELSWSILSTIGLFLTIVGIWAILITRVSPLHLVPIVVSIACAVANGLCYYAFYAEHPTQQQVVASVFADIFWLIQEAGLSFYSYQILVHTLKHRSLLVFRTIFWSLMTCIVAIRIAIAATRAIEIATNKPYQQRVDYLLVGYFTAIALVETSSAAFLICLLRDAYVMSPWCSPPHHLFRHLMQSTEIRLASLCCIGIMRAVTFSLRTSAQSATTVPSEVDRFAYTLECLFPVVMIIDILASKRFRFENHSLIDRSDPPDGDTERPPG